MPFPIGQSRGHILSPEEFFYLPKETGGIFTRHCALDELAVWLFPLHDKYRFTMTKLSRLLIRQLIWFAASFLLLWGSAFANPLTNQLKDHPSPYLALHGDDPVAWQDWGPAVLERAKKENKLVFLSIGYFSCHWCHVMQRESYKNPAIAALLNRYFIPVKIDRELEPALDGKVMRFVQSLRGSGGWPLNAFVTPEGYPVYATLYERPQNFRALLQRLANLWQKDDKKISTMARASLPGGDGPGKPKLDFKQAYQLLEKLGENARAATDEINGGFGMSNKFPMEPELSELLSLYQRYDHEYEVGVIIQNALDAMMNKALRDHINGGFFRYTTDPDWGTPHFEKMLYTNAQLALIYLRAGEKFNRKDYTRVAEETYRFLINNMLQPNGAFFGAFSAVDKNGKEGKAYLWDKAALKNMLTADQYKLAALMWHLDEPSAFDDGAYLPVPAVSIKDAAKKLGFSTEKARDLYDNVKTRLHKLAADKAHPADTKELAGWNGLALASFAEAARMTGNKQYEKVARGVRDFLVNTLWRNGELIRASYNDKPLGKASLQDYGFVSYGLMKWAMLTQDKKDFALAREIALNGYKKFYTATGWRMDDGGLIRYGQTRDVIQDGAMPSPSALLLLSMTRIGNQLGDTDLLDKARAALNSGWSELQANPFYYATRVEAAYVAAGTDTR